MNNTYSTKQTYIDMAYCCKLYERTRVIITTNLSFCVGLPCEVDPVFGTSG